MREGEKLSQEAAGDGSEFLNDMSNQAGGLTSALENELTLHIAALQDALESVALAEAQLDTAKEVLRKLQEEVIPNALDSAGLSELRMSKTGMVVFVKEDLRCGVPKDEIKAGKCFQFLTEHGGKDIIKNQVTIPEINNQVINDNLLDKLSALEIYYENDRTVNTNTLKAWFREQLGMKAGCHQTLEPSEVPKEFNLFRQRKAEIRQK